MPVTATTNTQYDPTINDTQSTGDVPGPKHPVVKNTVSQNESGGSTSQTNTTSENREAAKTVQQEVDEQMANDPEAQRLKALLSNAQSLANDWSLVEQNSWGAGDGIMELADIIAVSKDPLRPQHVRDAANRLLANTEILAGFNGDDSKAKTADVMAFITTVRSQIASLEASKTADVKEARGIQTNQNAATGGAGTGDATQAGGAGDAAAPTPDSVIAEAKNGAAPKPEPSTRGGLEGAEENTTNMMGWMEAETDRLTALMLKAENPQDQKALEMQLNQLSRRMQSMTAMLNQLTTMMSNISKMYADIAMNSIRNMR